MVSESSGNGQLYWQEQSVSPAFSRDRSVTFDVHHDGVAHDYAVEFSSKNPLLGIRIDPSRAAGQMRLSKIRLTTRDGRVLHGWNLQ